MPYKKIFFIMFFFSSLLTSVSGYAKMKFNMDYARFRYDTSSVYVEVYYSAFLDSTSAGPAVAEDDSRLLEFTVTKSTADSVLARDEIELDFKDGFVSEKTKGTVGMLKLILPTGKYLFSLAGQQDTVTQEVSVLPFDSDHVMMSDLELCTNIITDYPHTKNPYYKNTMQVIPNPSLLYGKGLPMLYYYLEMYNLEIMEANASDQLKVQVIVADPDGNIRMKKEYHRGRDLKSSVERGTFNISKLETGLYTLIFAATDPSKDEAVYRRRNFYVHNPDVLTIAENTIPDYVRNELMFLTEKELDDKFEQARYLASNPEKEVYKVLNTPDSKREFLGQFWKTRTKTDADYMQEYYERVEYANENYEAAGLKGWETDMGRVYILYGPADEYERFPSNPTENPYEIWYYHNIEGGVEFDFVDLSGFGDYRLVNSSKRDEITDPDWMRYIRDR